MLAAARFILDPRRLLRQRSTWIALVSLGLFAAMFLGLRLYYGFQPVFVPYGGQQGWERFVYNVARYRTWVEVVATLGIVPLLALASWRYWPDVLRRFFWAVVPLWFAAHFIGAIVAESRVLLVPQTLVFIPGALFGLARLASSSSAAQAPGSTQPGLAPNGQASRGTVARR
jgi:hypothetical protein